MIESKERLHVVLPQNFTINDINIVLDKVIDSDLNPKEYEINLDFRTLEYISSSAINLLDNLIGWLEENGVDVSYQIPTIGKKGTRCPFRFLNQSGVIKKHDQEREEPEKDKKILPIIDILHSEVVQFTSQDFSYWMGNLLNEDISRLGTIKTCMAEIFNNVNDHTNVKKAGMFAHFIRNENKFYISISDFGVGIPNKVRQKEDELTDENCLKWAVREGNTTNSIPRNTGAGLDFLVTNVVERGRGQVTIISNQASLVCSFAKEGKVEYNTSNRKSYYPGTFVEIIIPKEHIEILLDEQEEMGSWDV